MASSGTLATETSLADAKRGGVAFVILGEGMHGPEVVTAMEQPVGGIVGPWIHDGPRITPHPGVRNERGAPRLPGQFGSSLARAGMEVAPHVS